MAVTFLEVPSPLDRRYLTDSEVAELLRNQNQRSIPQKPRVEHTLGGRCFEEEG